MRIVRLPVMLPMLSNASPPGDVNASAATNLPSQPSPEFLATLVQAVKAALAAEQASVPCPASSALPNSGQSSSTASRSSAMAFGGVPLLLSSQASAFAASGAGFAAPVSYTHLTLPTKRIV